jgi:alpha-galactosidase
MPILHDPGTMEFHLSNELLSYVMRVLPDGRLGHLHFGSPIAAGRSYARLAGASPRSFERGGGDRALLEYPARGTGDFRVPAIEAEFGDGSRVVDPRYAGHRIFRGKPAIPGLPSTYAEEETEAETLEIELEDGPGGISICLRYSIFEGRPVVARSASVRNAGASRAVLRCAMSASLDLPDSGWEMLTYSGTWARERHESRRPLFPGRQGLESVRGASSHQHNPFIALARPYSDEEHGEAYGLGLVYSGNFLAEAEVGLFGTTRLRIGVEPSTFAWVLEPGETFDAPEAILCYSAAGLGGLSDAFHCLYRERLARGPWRDRPRPILLNNWEGTYFDFDEKRLLDMARAAAGLGIELFVLDDGWFGERDSDESSLGDWTPDPRKLPGGLGRVAQAVEEMGMRFGLWMEPEMVSPRSRLFESHPGWAIGIPGRPRTRARNQYVLDLSNPEVVDYLYGVMTGILRSAPISYVKWDMNRNITEAFGASLPPERQGEFFHRYILGVYGLYRRLTAEFPELLFESCAGGGGRFDPGMLAYAPQAWTSDDTDAVERIRIQWGSSMSYPLSSMGAHVSAVPNHQTGRITPLATRAAVSFFGLLGYELDPSALSPQERGEIAWQTAFYKGRRELFQRGRFVRLLSPFDGQDRAAWMVVSADRRSAAVGYYRTLNRPSPSPERLRLRGLDLDASYRVSLCPGPAWPGDPLEADNAGIRGGDELMAAGLLVSDDVFEAPRRGDFWSILFLLEAE